MDQSKSDSIKRQTDINVWYYKYRMETLFVVQLLFIGLSGLILLTILSTYGIVPRIFTIYYGVIVIFMIGVIWYYKSSYTSTKRDPYHWDKIRFAADSTTHSPFNSSMKAAITQGIAAHCPS
jgi:NhaP-type Na+/H+ or K+/H+ antiporter